MSKAEFVTGGVENHDLGSMLDINEKRLRRKIDWRIVPLMFACYLLQFVDKVLVNYANIMGIQKDLGMKGQAFSWMATAFFIGYAVAEFPQGALLQRFPVAKVLGFNIVCWGIVLCCTAACQNTASIIATRTLLGCLEAVISPALVIITSMWYTKREAGPRYGIWYCGLGAGQILGGLISFGAQHGSTTSSFQSWRIMFVCVGAINIVVAMSVLLWMPDSVESAAFLTQGEKKVLFSKLAVDQAGAGNKVFKAASLWDVITDLQMWFLCLLTILITIPSGVITTFSAILIKGFGYTSEQSALLNIPGGVISILSTMISTAAILKGFPRWLSIVLLLIPAVLGGALMSFLPKSNQGGTLAGIYLINTTVAPLALIYSWVGSNVGGYTKKVGANAMIAIAFSIANIIGPQTFQDKDAPGYLPAKITILAVDGAAIVVVIGLRLLYGIRNRRTSANRAASVSEIGPNQGYVDGLGVVDQTDRENPVFKYVY